MPTYDYICSNCGRTSEIVHSISGGPPAACPACGAVGTLRKAFNPPTIHFKGSGWAKKDRSGGHSRPARPGETAATNGTGADGGSDSGERHQGEAAGDGESRSKPAAGEGSTSSRSGEAGARSSASDKRDSTKGDSNKGGEDKRDSNKASSDKAGSSAAAD